MFRKIFSIIICLIIITNSIIYADDNIEISDEKEDIDTISQTVSASSELAELPNLNARIAVAYDRKSGRVIFGKDENKRTAMASTTKIMTAIILLENADLNQTVIVSRKSRRDRWLKTRFKEK